MPRFSNRNNTGEFDEAIEYNDEQLMTDAAGEEGVEQPIEEWQPYCMQDIDFSTVDDEYTDDPQWCFLCRVSQSKYDAADNQHLQGLLKYMDENYHLVAPKTLCSEAQIYYNTHLRPYLMEPKVWRKAIIYEHLDQHAPTNRIMHEDSLRTYSNILRVLRDGGLFIKEQNTNRINVDRKVLDMYIRVERQRSVILKRTEEKRPHTLL